MMYAVRCDDFETKPSRTREAAEARLVEIEKNGRCRLDHQIVEVEK